MFLVPLAFFGAEQANLTVIRMFAYGVTPGYQLQVAPQQYNETALRDLDYVVSEAGKRNLKLIVALSSNWVYNTNTSGSKCAAAVASPAVKRPERRICSELGRLHGRS